MPRTVKILTHAALARLNRKAIRAKASRSIKLGIIAQLPQSQLYPISETLLHNDMDIRARIILNDRGDAAELDMTLSDYERIPRITVPDHAEETQ